MSTAQVLAAKPATCKHALVAIFTDEHRLASCCLKFLPALVLNMCNQDFVPHLHDYAETKSFIFVVCNIYTKQLFCVFSLPAGAVAKYCDDHVYVCLYVCLLVCTPEYLWNHRCDLYLWKYGRHPICDG